MLTALNHLTELCIILFLIITFSISVIEKIADWKGTIAYISETFKNSILENSIKPILLLLVFLETISCYFLIVGFVKLAFYGQRDFALYGCLFSVLAILSMLIGQRIVKDYPGATSLGVYFLISIFGVFLLN